MAGSHSIVWSRGELIYPPIAGHLAVDPDFFLSKYLSISQISNSFFSTESLEVELPEQSVEVF